MLVMGGPFHERACAGPDPEIMQTGQGVRLLPKFNRECRVTVESLLRGMRFFQAGLPKS
jgi:hypothetical protein